MYVFFYKIKFFLKWCKISAKKAINITRNVRYQTLVDCLLTL